MYWPVQSFFNLNSEDFIDISGKWAILDKNGTMSDEGSAQQHSSSLKVHHLLQHKITDYSIPNAVELQIKFSDGSILIIHDDDPIMNVVPSVRIFIFE